MPSHVMPSLPVANRLLAALPKKEYRRLVEHLEQVSLTFAEILYEPGDPIRFVYFPNDSIISVLSVAERSTLEVGIVGNEGMAGISVFMGVRTSRHRALVQGSGTAMKMAAAALQKESEHIGPLHRLLHRYSHSLLTQVSQSAVCNRFHMVDARLACWLLMTRDRMKSNEFRLTQEFMSNMLGVRREGVTKAASALQQDNLISYSRGHMVIHDRAGLEAVSCECYGLVRKEYESFLN